MAGRMSTEAMADLFMAHREGRLPSTLHPLFDHVVALRGDLLAIQVKQSAQKDGDWFMPEEVPLVAVGEIKEKIVVTLNTQEGSKRRGLTFVSSAWYLNAFPLYYEDGCLNDGEWDGKECPCAESGNGCPQTGWHQVTPNPDYEMFYEPLIREGSTELLGWKNLPAWSGARDMTNLERLGGHGGSLYATLIAIDHLAEARSDPVDNIETIRAIRKIAEETRAAIYPPKKEEK